jgi:hypothetical protein
MLITIRDSIVSTRTLVLVYGVKLCRSTVRRVSAYISVSVEMAESFRMLPPVAPVDVEYECESGGCVKVAAGGIPDPP